MKQRMFIIVLSLIISSSGFSQGKLQKAKKSLNSSANRSSKNSSKTTSGSYKPLSVNSSDPLFVLGVVFVEALLYVVYYSMVETPLEYEKRANNASITKYPYYNSKKGNYSYNWGDDTAFYRTTFTNRVIIENSELYGNHLNADVRFLQRAGIELDYLQLWENNSFFGNNSLALFTVLAKYHRVRTEKFNAYWGLGATYVTGGVDELGFTYGVGAELFFAKPLSLESNFNQSFINSRSINKFNLLLNYHIDRFKITGGYEYLNIGSIESSTFSAGVGISF